VNAVSSAAEATARFTKTGDYELHVAAMDDGCEATVNVRVDPGPLKVATCPASGFPLCQECDMEVLLEDEFGNRVTDYAGTISLELPAGGLAKQPAPLVLTAADGGHGFLRGVLLVSAGPTLLVFKDGDGTVVSQPG